jgi:hypothetical protein
MQHQVIIGCIYTCKNVEKGCGVWNIAKKRADKATQFTSYVGECWKQYPEEVCERYEHVITPVSDDGGSTMISPGLCEKLLYDQGTFEGFARQLQNSLDLRRRSAEKDYYQFVWTEVQKMRERSKPAQMSDECFDAYKSLQWPRFDSEPIEETFKMPCGATCQRIFHEAYDKIEDYLLHDLFSRRPGKILRWDGTFAIMKKTMDAPPTEATNDALVKILGEYGHLLTWAFTEAEDDEVVQRLLYFLKMRAFRLGGQPAVDEVIAAYTDTCCQGRLDPESHFLTSLFPMCKRAPLKDVFHGVKGILNETTGFGHPLYESLRKGLWKAVFKWDEESVQEALAHFKQKDKDGQQLADICARDIMFEKKEYRESMYNYINEHATEVERDVRKLYKDI